MRFETFGIIGYGHFGQFLASSLARHGKVLVYDADEAKIEHASDGIRPASLDEVATADAVILAVPFAALAVVLDEIRDRLGRETVVMDVVSSKQRATQLLVEALPPDANVLATHPLFGPPSMTRIEPGLRIVVTAERGPAAAGLREFLEQELGLIAVSVSPDEHDRAMAYMQSLPFFIARALVSIDVLELEHRDVLAIPSFEKLAEIAFIEQQHTVDMFDTSQISNPYADEARRHFLAALQQLQAEIEAHRAGEPAGEDG
ncbi:MAG TPA: prephenate dehydrogenase [Acidimicrobiia bacterium]|nr:prephenate dehydrogenase [Acidimicrobiia bacterium]